MSKAGGFSSSGPLHATSIAPSSSAATALDNPVKLGYYFSLLSLSPLCRTVFHYNCFGNPSLKAKLIQQQQLQLAKCYSSKTKTPKKATTTIGNKPENQKNKKLATAGYCYCCW
jgi:hypothetical protein